MKWWLYIALKQLFPTGRGISFFAAVSVLGVALGVLGLFGTQSVMNGFHPEISVKLRDTSGDIIIRDYGKPMYSLDELKARLKALPEVASVEFVAQGPVMMVANNVPIFPVLRSYDTISGDCALPMKEKNFVKMGSLDDLDDDSVIVGQRLAASAGMGVGDKVDVFSPTMLDSLKRDEVPMAASLDVVGLLATDYSQVDSNVAIVSLRRMRDLYNLGGGSHSVVVRLKDEFAGEAEAFAKRLSSGEIVPRRYCVSTWLGANEAFLRVIKMEKVMMSLIIFLIILVASFSICISLYTSVLRKTREIGLSAAMGAPAANRGNVLFPRVCDRRFRLGARAAADSGAAAFSRADSGVHRRARRPRGGLPLRAPARKIRARRRSLGVRFLGCAVHFGGAAARAESRAAESFGGHAQ